MQHHKPGCYAEQKNNKKTNKQKTNKNKKMFTVFNVKVTARAYIIKIWLLLLCLLNCWSVCNQSWFDSTAVQAGVFYGNVELLRSSSRSQRKFKMSLNVGWSLLYHRTFCYQIWYGDASPWAWVSCKKTTTVSSRSRSQGGLIWSNCLFLLYFLIC